MRYYRLTITNPKQTGGTSKTGASVRATRSLTFCSYFKPNPNGAGYMPGHSVDQFDPGALDLQFQITETGLNVFEVGSGGVAITVLGVDIVTINQAAKLAGRTVRLEVGMGKGLPLANPAQAGEILHGTVASAVGNWEGTMLALTLYVMPYVVPPANQSNIIGAGIGSGRPIDNMQFHCPRGSDLITATFQAIQAASQGYQFVSHLDGPVPAPRNVLGIYATFKDLMTGIGLLWKDATGKDVIINMQGNKVVLGTAQSARQPVKIAFQDLIGQPSWNGINNISFCCPMRADLKVMDRIQLPDLGTGGSISAAGADTIAAPRNRSLFSGVFTILRISHLGQFRSSDGLQWSSTFTCVTDGTQ